MAILQELALCLCNSAMLKWAMSSWPLQDIWHRGPLMHVFILLIIIVVRGIVVEAYSNVRMHVFAPF
jgi:hypothetical protein